MVGIQNAQERKKTRNCNKAAGNENKTTHSGSNVVEEFLVHSATVKENQGFKTGNLALFVITLK
jgi:hypothetical protein